MRRFSLFRFWILLLMILLLPDCGCLAARRGGKGRRKGKGKGKGGKSAKAQAPKHDLYFFGNSYTQYNTLGYRVKRMYGRGLPPPRPKVDTANHMKGGLSFWDHLQWLRNAKGKGVQNFLSRKFNWVILQEQSLIPSIPKYRQSSAMAAKALDRYVQQRGENSQTIFFMTWGRRNGWKGRGMRYPDFKQHNAALLEGYLLYVKVTSTPARPTYVAPVGLVFQTIYEDCIQRGERPEDKDTLFHKLYNKDGSHPSGLGTYAAALTIATSITGFDPKRHPLDDPDKSRSRVAVQDAVSRTILETFHSGLIRYPWSEPWTVRNKKKKEGDETAEEKEKEEEEGDEEEEVSEEYEEDDDDDEEEEEMPEENEETSEAGEDEETCDALFDKLAALKVDDETCEVVHEEKKATS